MRFLIAMTSALWLAASAPVHADGPYEGPWIASSLQVRYQVSSWGTHCGPRPPGSTSEPGGPVTVRQSGDTLTFTGAVRGVTNGCWSDNPEVRRISSRYQSGTWTTTCATSSSNSKPERGQYTLRASGDQLSFRETTSWDWQLQDSHCVATRTATRTFTRVGEGPSEPEEPEEPAATGCTPGAPARLRLGPAEANLEPGERVCFRPRVTDAAGCPVPSARVQLALDAPTARQARLDGRCFQAARTAAEGEGEFRVIATSGGLRDVARVRVAPADLSGLVAQRRGTGGTEGDEIDPSSTGASGVAARALQDGPGAMLWLGLAGALLLVLGIGVVVWVLRRQATRTTRAAAMSERPPDSMTPGSPTPDATTSDGAARAAAAGNACPSCGRTAPAGTTFCPHDGTPLSAPPPAAPAPAPSGPTGAAAATGETLICPRCRRGFPATTTMCPTDQVPLLPYATFVAEQKQAEESQQRVCPKCGTRYEGTVQFCGKDGATLVQAT